MPVLLILWNDEMIDNKGYQLDDDLSHNTGNLPMTTVAWHASGLHMEIFKGRTTWSPASLSRWEQRSLPSMREITHVITGWYPGGDGSVRAATERRSTQQRLQPDHLGGVDICIAKLQPTNDLAYFLCAHWTRTGGSGRIPSDGHLI